MFRQMLRSKIHRVKVSDACLEYEGSITVDETLLQAAGILSILCRAAHGADGGPPGRAGHPLPLYSVTPNAGAQPRLEAAAKRKL